MSAVGCVRITSNFILTHTSGIGNLDAGRIDCVENRISCCDFPFLQNIDVFFINLICKALAFLAGQPAK